MVLDDGSIVEFDSPKQLLNTEWNPQRDVGSLVEIIVLKGVVKHTTSLSLNKQREMNCLRCYNLSNGLE